jgi:hypothetical protein
MRISFEAAFALEPRHSLVLGAKAYDVPPLTLGRFLALTSIDFNVLLTAFAAATMPDGALDGKGLATLKVFAARAREGNPSLVRDALLSARPDLVRSLARSLQSLENPVLALIAAAVVPDLEARDWLEHGTPVKVLELFEFFYRVHDWAFIGKTIKFGEAHADDERPATKSTVAGALVAFCRAHPFVSPESLLAMRVEGFFYMRSGAEEAADLAESVASAEAGVSQLDGEEMAAAANVPSGSAPSSLLAAMDEAEKKAGIN